MKKALGLLLFAILLSACHFPEREAAGHRDLALADMILEDAELVLGRNGENPIRLQASRISFYQAEDLALMEEIAFTQADGLEGSAESAELDTRNEILTLSGDAVISKPSEGLEIRSGDGIVFDSKRQEVATKGEVMVRSEDGEFLGEGFFGDLKTESYSFERIRRGSFGI